jgi:DNA-binding XRE family transcriptional regulator
MVHEVYSANDLGRAIKELRAELGMTQEALASWCGVSRQTIVSLEHGGPVAVTVALTAITLLGAKLIVAPKNLVLDDAES